MTQIWWLSFASAEKHLGVAIVEVEDLELEENDTKGWLKEAIRTAWLMGCNPGGSVGAYRLDHLPPWEKNKHKFVFNRLLTAKQVEELGL